MSTKLIKSIFPLLLAIFFATILIQSFALPDASRQFPMIISLAALVLLIWQIAADLLHKDNKPQTQELEAEVAAKDKAPWYKNKNFQVGALLVLYLAAMNLIGFVVSTALYVASTMYLLGRRGKTLYIQPVIIALCAWLVFGILFHVRLPHGFLF